MENLSEYEPSSLSNSYDSEEFEEDVNFVKHMLKIKNLFIDRLDKLGKTRYNIEYIREESCSVYFDGIHMEYNPINDTCSFNGMEMENLDELFHYIEVETSK